MAFSTTSESDTAVLNRPPITREIHGKPHPKMQVTARLSTESNIVLVSLKYESHPQNSVFIYPHSFGLNEENILALDGRFEEIYNIGKEREFKNYSPERLSRGFIAAVRPAISVMDNQYPVRNFLVLEHVFAPEHYAHIQRVINEMEESMQEERLFP